MILKQVHYKVGTWPIWLATLVAVEVITLLGLATGLVVVLWPGQAAAIGTVLSALAALALAAITLAVVLLNRQLLKATAEAVKAATAEAAASSRQAELTADSVREMRTSRHLEFRPFLIRQDLRDIRTSPAGLETRLYQMQNIGRGPALNCIFLREYQTPGGRVYQRAGPVDLAPGADVRLPAEPVGSAAPQSLLHGGDHLDEVLLCQDQFNNVLRFSPGYATPKEWQYEVDEEGMEQNVPDWVDSYMAMLRSRP